MIAFEELFPYDELKAMLADLQTQEGKLSSGRESFSNKYKETLKEEIKLLGELKATLSGVGVAMPKGGDLPKLAEEVDNATKKVARFREMILSLKSAEDANAKSIEMLRGVLSELKTQYDKLDPTSSGFINAQKEIAEKSKWVKQAMDAQLSTLKLAVKEVVHTGNSYRSLNAETVKMRNSLKSMSDAFDVNTGKINKNNTVAVELQKNIERNDKALKAMDASMGLHQRNVGNYKSAFDGISGALVQFTGIAGGVDLVVTAIQKSFEVITTFDKYRQIITFASKSTEAFNKNLAFLENLADSTGTNIEVLYKKFGSFSIAASQANFAAGETNRIFASIIKAGGAYKMSNEAVALSLKAVEQIMNKGKLSMEELSQQLGDHLPGALGLFADGLGISTAKLISMIKSGELFAKETLPLFAANLEKVVGKEAQNNVNTISGSWNRLTNQLKLFIDEFAQNLKVNSFFASINNGIADTFKGIRELVRSDEWMRFATILGLGITNPIGAINTLRGVAARGDANRKAQSLSAKGQIDNFKSASPSEQQRILSAQQAGAASAKAEFDNLKPTPYNKEKREELRLYANEQYLLLNTYKKLATSKTEVTKVTGVETDAVKALRKEHAELRKQLEEGAKAQGKNYIKTEAGAKALSRYKEITKELKQNKIDAGIGSTPKVNDDTKVEKLTKDLNKMRDSIANQAFDAIKSKKALELPEEVLNKWRDQYRILVETQKALGQDIPDAIKKFNEAIDPLRVGGGSERLSPNGTKPVYSKDAPIDYSKPLQQNINTQVTKKGGIGDGMNEYINLVKQQGFEAMRLQESFSRGLRGLKKSERDELMAIQREIFEAQQRNNKEEEDASRAKYAAEKERILGLRDERKKALEEAFNLAQTIGQGIFDVSSAYRDREIEQITKKKEFELSLVKGNADAQKSIEEKADREIREVRRRQAKADKAAALFNIAMDTTRGVMSVLSTGGGTRFADLGVSASILMGLVIATGLAQAAAVAARPLPEFAKGTDNAPEGLALVGEKGAELRESNGHYTYYDKPTVTHLKKGDKIFTASETASMLKYSVVADKLIGQQEKEVYSMQKSTNIMYQLDTNAIVEGLGKKFSEALANQPYLKQIPDGDELATVLVAKGQMTKYLNKKRF